mmetsp:Transcript_42697/g.129701  ORF Transcript_42697/g.129701 Transcript_42697/m.129701 type:complete len:201 (+) Transcript_42697:772-1374(+)
MAEVIFAIGDEEVLKLRVVLPGALLPDHDLPHRSLQRDARGCPSPLLLRAASSERRGRGRATRRHVLAEWRVELGLTRPRHRRLELTVGRKTAAAAAARARRDGVVAAVMMMSGRWGRRRERFPPRGISPVGLAVTVGRRRRTAIVVDLPILDRYSAANAAVVAIAIVPSDPERRLGVRAGVRRRWGEESNRRAGRFGRP